jgi:hypothetical protein
VHHGRRVVDLFPIEMAHQLADSGDGIQGSV